MAQMTLKNIELQAYYDAQFEMMATPAWKQLMEDVRAIRDARQDPRLIPDAAALHRIQGELIQIDWLLGREDALRLAHDHLLAEELGAE